jgi:hypothetical protein
MQSEFIGVPIVTEADQVGRRGMIGDLRTNDHGHDGQLIWGSGNFRNNVNSKRDVVRSREAYPDMAGYEGWPF